MTTLYSKKNLALIPTALSLIFYAFAYISGIEEQQAQRAFQLFKLSLHLKQYAKAQGDIDRAISLSPKNAYYVASQGLLLMRMSRRKFDLRSFGNTINFSQEELEQIRSAVQSYQKALQLNPLDDSYYHNLGWLYWFLQQRDQALNCFQKAISIDGSTALYHVSLALFYEHQGKKDDAHREYVHAVRLSPSILDSQFFRDLRERSQGEGDRIVSESISHLEDQLRRSPDPIVKGKLGKLYLQMNLLDKASVVLKEALIELPSLSRSWSNLGTIYEIQGDEPATRECYRRATFLSESDAGIWLTLGNFDIRHHDNDDAIRSYTRALTSGLNIASQHAGRVAHIYHTQIIIPDDILPNGFLSYCNPSFDISGVCLILAKLYDQTGDIKMSNYYEGLSNRLADDRQLERPTNDNQNVGQDADW